MKAWANNRLWRCRYALLMIAAILGCGIFAYYLFFKPQIPECRAVVRAVNDLPEGSLQRILLVSVVPDGPRRATILLNGSFYEGDTRYVIARVLQLEYQRQGSNYALQVKKNVRRPTDSVVKDELNRRLPAVGGVYHLRIERLDRYHYLFAGNYSPFFVCSSGG